MRPPASDRPASNHQGSSLLRYVLYPSSASPLSALRRRALAHVRRDDRTRKRSLPGIAAASVMRRCFTSAVCTALALLVADPTVASSALPASFVLLPLASFTNNASLVAPYSCAPMYASLPCSGHGACFLLLDAADNTSQPLLNVSSARPLPAASSALDTYGIDNSTRLPAAVCVCDSGWTGRGDYLSHGALDGDSCGISDTAIDALSIVGLVLYVPLLLLAMHRLYLWSVWHGTSASLENGAVGPMPVGEHAADGAAAIALRPSSFSQDLLPPPRLASNSTSSVSSAAQSDTTAQKHARTFTASIDSEAPHARPSNDREPHLGSGSRHRQRRSLLRAHLSHITFVHPLFSLQFALLSIYFFLLRLTTMQTVGLNYGMSTLAYLTHIPFIVCVTLGMANTLQVCGAIVGKQHKHLLSLIATAHRYLTLLLVYDCLSYVLVYLIHVISGQQQLLSQLVLLLCWAPDHLLFGPLSIICFQRLLPALIADIDKLPAAQQAARLAVHRKLRSFSYLIGFMCLGTVTATLVLAISPALRQTGLPVYTFVWYYSSYSIVAVRLLLIRPPATGQQGKSATPVQLARELALKAKARRTASISAVELPSVSSSAGMSDAAGPHAVDAGTGGWADRTRRSLAMQVASGSSRIDEGDEPASRAATPMLLSSPTARG